MFIARLLTTSFLIALCAAPAVAQSAPMKTSEPTDSNIIHIDSPESILRIAGLSGGAAANNTPATSDSPQNFRLRPSRHLPLQTLAETSDDTSKDTVCFSMRTYRVVRDDPKSDGTRKAGYSTCQPSTQYRVKSTVGSLDIIYP